MWELIAGEARIIDGLPIDDRGFLLGDGVFETFRIAGGRIRHAPLHAASLAAGCAALQLDMPDWSNIETAVSRLIEGDNSGGGKVIVSRGTGGRGLSPIIDPAVRVFFQMFEAPLQPKAVVLATVGLRRSTSSLAARFKTLSYVDNLAARREAVARGGDVALLFTESGLVSGTDSANLFWERAGQVYTPSEKCGIRNGVMRRCVLEWLRRAGIAVEEVQADVDTLMSAQSVWITNAVTGVTPVSAIDGVRFSHASDVLENLRAAEL